MRSDEFLSQVRELGEHADQGAAEQVTRMVPGVLATRIQVGGIEHLGAQPPDSLGEALRPGISSRPSPSEQRSSATGWPKDPVPAWKPLNGTPVRC